MSVTLRRRQPSGATLGTTVRNVRLGQVLKGLSRPGLWRIDWIHKDRRTDGRGLALFLVDAVTGGKGFELILPLDTPITLAREEDIQARIRTHVDRLARADAGSCAWPPVYNPARR